MALQPMARRALIAAALVICFAALEVPAGDASFIGEILQKRQVATKGVNTNISSASNGGENSAKEAASAAGQSINTGEGGARGTPDSPAEFAKLLSGTFFGALLTIIFGGALFVQIWHYFERFGGRGQDRHWLQLTVTIILVFSLIQSAVLIHRVWEIHVANFGNFAFPLLTVGWEIAMSFVCIGINTCVIQCYYVHRLWLAFNKKRLILVLYAPLVTYTFAGGVASAALILGAGSAANVKGQALHSFQPDSIPWQYSVVFATWLCDVAAIEISICLSLIWQLTKVSTPFFHTRHALARLLLLSLETAIATTTFALVSMILFLAIPYQFYYNIAFLPIGQVSASSFLVTLMARPSIARELAQDQMMTLEGGLEAASSRAPKSLAKPVVKRMMRNEWKKRPQGDGTGVNMTVTVHEEAFAEKGGTYSPTSSHFGSDMETAAGKHQRLEDARSQWRSNYSESSAAQPAKAANANAATATHFLDAVVVGSEAVGLNHMANQHTKAKNKNAGLTSTNAAGEVGGSGAGAGGSGAGALHPRGRAEPSFGGHEDGASMSRDIGARSPSPQMIYEQQDETSDETMGGYAS